MHGEPSALTLLDLLAARHAERGSAPAILAPGREALSYAQLHVGIDRAGAALAAVGLGRGHRIATALADGPDTGVAMLAAMAWSTCTPLDPRADADACRALFAQLRVDALVVEEGGDSPAAQAARAAGLTVLRLDVARLGEGDLIALRAESLRTPIAQTAPQPDDIALVAHTSGTTSKPKVVPATQRALVWTRSGTLIGAADRYLSVSPLHTTSGIGNALMLPIKAGASTVLTAGFDAARFFDWLEEFKPTYYSASPTVHATIVDDLLRHPRSLPASVRFVRSSSSAMAASLQERVESALGVPVIQGYGSTEAGLIAHDSPLPGRRRAGSVGMAAGIDIMILGEHGAALAAGDVGEILVRGPTVMAGYENDPEANRLAFHDGWFRTGDLGYRDPDGYLFITGRSKDVINRGGLKVSPGEVDAMFARHPAVREAATVGMAHPSLGEDVATAVMLRQGESVTAQELRDFALRNIAPHKVPSSVVIVGDFPRNALGKVLRPALAVVLKDALRADFVAPRDPEEALVAGVFAALLEAPRVGARDNFFVLGGDSLRAARALARIAAQTGVEMGPRALFEAPTVARLAQRLRAALGALPMPVADEPRLARRARRAVGAPAAATPRSGSSEA